ncbi:MAG: serpin family protein, partial [Defluviitaleaceae bacterium]|nr:serpin family protein [Defluviitaleaceae bacterium]
MRKIWVVLLFVLMVGLAGCGQVEGHIERVWDSQEMQGMTPTMPPVTPTLPLNPAPVVSVTSNIYQAANDFAFRLTSTLLGASGDGNFVLSPFSVWLPLAALANVTCEELLPELLGALSLDCEVPTRQINRTVRQMLGRLTNEGFSEHMPSPLSIANAIYTRDDYTLNSDFARIFAHYFMGELDQVNFLNPATADIVNAWAYEHTDGRIPQVVSPDMFNELTAALIANAILFQGDWRWQFEPELTTRGNFYGAQGTTQAYLMERVFDDVGNTTVMFFEDDEVEALQLLFQQGGAMTILLPR